LKIAFYGSSLLSSYWNGAATYYRGLLKALAARDYDVTFYEPDVYDRQQHRDIDPPYWCRVVVYDGTLDALQKVALEAGSADIVVKTSGVGFEDDALLEAVFAAAKPDALKIFWDVDAPATLAELRDNPEHPLRKMLPKIDAVLTYGGGQPVIEAYRQLGAAECVPIYNALDPETHHPVAPYARFACDLAFLGNRLPDREARVEEFFLSPAAALPQQQFVIGGAGWDGKPMPANVRAIGHVGTRHHNAFNITPKAVLNISRASMAETGFSPATRVFEAAGAGACIITDAWEGIEVFLQPDQEILVARDGREVGEIVAGLGKETARAIGLRAMGRVLAQHTYGHRAADADAVFKRLRQKAGEMEAAE
jgi:spore maturation protein CgeB